MKIRTKNLLRKKRLSNAELHLYWDTENVTWRDITNTYTLRKV